MIKQYVCMYVCIVSTGHVVRALLLINLDRLRLLVHMSIRPGLNYPVNE